MICGFCLLARHARCRGCGCNVCHTTRRKRRNAPRPLKKGELNKRKESSPLTPEQRERINARARQLRQERAWAARREFRKGRPNSYTYEQARMVPDLRAMGYSQLKVAEMLGLGNTPDSGRQMVRRIERNPVAERASS